MTKARGLLLVYSLVFGMWQTPAVRVECDCGFSKFQPRRVSDFADRVAVKKVTPEYPPAARAKGLSGTVRVRILINKQGLVERTCPTHPKGQPKPDRALVVAAEAAALQWTFRPNFGIESSGGPRFDYIEDVLLFRFVAGEGTSK